MLHKCDFVEGNEYLRKGKIDLWLTLGSSWEETDGFLKKELLYRKGALIYSAKSLPGKKDDVSAFAGYAGDAGIGYRNH